MGTSPVVLDPSEVEQDDQKPSPVQLSPDEVEMDGQPQVAPKPAAVPLNIPTPSQPSLVPNHPLSESGSIFDDEHLGKTIGAVYDKAVVPVASAIDKYAVEPFDKMAQAGAEIGRGIGGADLQDSQTGKIIPQSKVRLSRSGENVPDIDVGERERGIQQAVGSVVGSTVADPRNWPLAAEGTIAPLGRRAMAAGFAGMMGKGAVEGAEHFGSVMDNPNVSLADKTEAAATPIISAAMAGMSGAHVGAEHVQDPAHPEDLTSPSEALPQPIPPAPVTLSPDEVEVEPGGPNALQKPSGTAVGAHPAGDQGAGRVEQGSGVGRGQQGPEVAQEGQEAAPQRAQEVNPEIQPVGTAAEIKHAFRTDNLKNAAGDGLINSMWDRLSKGKKVLFADKGGIEGRVQAAFDAGQIKSREDVMRVARGEESQPSTRAPSKTENAAIREVGKTRGAVVLDADTSVPKLAKGVGKVELPDGRTAIFARSKATAADVLKLYAENALHRLTGEAPPQQAVELAKADIKGEPESLAARGPEATAELGRESSPAIAELPQEDQHAAAESDIHAQADQMRMNLEEIAEHDPELAKRIEEEHPSVKAILAKSRELASNREAQNETGRDENAVRQAPTVNAGEVRENSERPQVESAVPEKAAAQEVERRSLPRSETSQILLNKMHDELRASTDPQERAELEQHIKRESDLADADAILKAKGPTPTPAIDISPTRRNELKQQVSNLEAKSREYPSKLTSAERTDIYRKQYALKDEIGKIDAENYKNNLQLNDAMRDWKSGRAYIDNGGNYRLYGEKRGFDGRDGRIAPWNKAAKVAFADSNELGHAGTAIYPTQEEAQKQMREEKEARHRDTADVAHPNDPLHFGNQQRYREEGSWHYRNSDGSHWTRVTDPKTKARFDAEYKNDEGQYKDLSKTEQFDAAVERTGAKVEEGKPSSLFRSKIKDAHDANLSDETTAALRAEIKDTPKFQREYFTSALQPALDAWKQHLGEKDFEKWASSKGTDKYPTKPTGDKNRFGADETARTFPDGLRKDQIYIKVPDDGHFLVNNNPFAIEKALKGATEGFAKVKSRPFEESPGKEANPRSPKEFDNEKYIVGLERELEKLRDKGAYGSAAEVAYHKDQINAAEENLRQATSLSGKPPESEKAEARSKEAGFVKAEALNPVAMAQAGADVYHDFIDKALEKMEIGQPRPEIRKIDPQAADLALRMDAGGQYHKAVGEAIAKRVTDPMLEDFNKKDSPQVTAEKNKVTRDRMKGFHFLADAQNREWLKENKPEDFARWSADPKIQQAIENYKQPQEDLRQAVKELGGKTIDQDYIKRVMDFVTSGIAEFDEERGGKQFGMSSRDNVVGPQVDRSHQRTADAGFYWEHGVFDFGPSFEKRYSEVMHKLDENKLAVHVMSRGTRLESGDALPDSIIYNGERFYRPEIAKEIRDIQKKGSSADSKELAEELGVEELPLPKNVQEYSLYQPLKGARFERAAKGLASSAIEGADSKVLEAQGYNVNRMAGLKYAVPKDLADAMNDAERTTGQGRIARVVSNLLSPITQAIRQQIVGLAYGIPHMGNIIRKVMQATPGAQLNPLAWVNGVKVAFSKELKARGASGVNDNTYAMLLRNAGISEGAVPEYKHYIEGNFDVANWKNLLAEPNRNFVKNAFKEGGRARGDVTVKSSLAGLPRLAFEPLNRFSEAGHNNLFKAGGIDQRARLWMADMLQERFPKMKESDIAHAVNQQLGRYNRASWTDVQRGAAPYMLFPGWDYSSITYAVKHPLKTTVPAAVLMLIANRTFNALGMNEDKDKNDLTRLHIGQRSFKSNIVSDNMGNHVLGWALRGGQAALDHKNRRDIMGAAVKGIPGDVGGATVDTLNPVLSGIGEVAYGKTRSGGGRDIMPGGDLKKRGRILPNKGAEDLTDFAARKAFPIYDTVRGDQRPDAISSAGRLAGISTYSTKKKR